MNTTAVPATLVSAWSNPSSKHHIINAGAEAKDAKLVVMNTVSIPCKASACRDDGMYDCYICML